MNVLYFAYGSNMSRRQMAERCPDNECIGKAVLPDHELCFPRSSPIRVCGVAGFVTKAGSEVWGVVYRIREMDLVSLDRREGYHPSRPYNVNRYNRGPVRVLFNGEPIDCLTYFAREEPGHHIPIIEYMNAIITGAEEHGLPESYVASLKAIPTLSPSESLENPFSGPFAT